MELRAWDFGGQQIYHATHQFFLTNRSLFLLLWNARLGWEQGKLRYWLDIITARAPESPVFLIATHADSNERPVDLPLDDLRREYPQVIDNISVDNETRAGIDNLYIQLAQQAAGLPLMGAEWPTAWLDACDALRNCADKNITPNRMKLVIEGAGVSDQAQQQYIAIAMHQLGDILYYSDDPDLADTVILRPEWVNEYICKVLDDREVANRHGLLTREHLNILWRDLDRGLRDHFLRMMDKYDLSYQISDTPGTDVSLVVERLPWNTPPYKDEWPLDCTEPNIEINVLYRLNTMPPGIPTWFIARSHRFTTGQHWRTGVLLAHSDQRHRALVAADLHRNIVKLSVRGPSPAAFFSILDDGLNRTFERFPGLDILRQVPCPCQKAVHKTCAELFDYDDLQNRLLRAPPRHDIECRKSGEMIDVATLLFGLPPSDRDATRASLDRLLKITEEINDRLSDQCEYAQRMFLKIQRILQDQQEVRCPSVFALVSRARKGLRGSGFELRLYCEEPGSWHRLADSDGCYQIIEPAEWLRKIGPYLKHVLTVLKHAAPLVGPVLGMTVGALNEYLQADINAMTEVVAQLPDTIRYGDPLDEHANLDSIAAAQATDEADFRTLEQLLTKLDPLRLWGGLSRTVTPEGLTLYLCRVHSETYRISSRS